MKILITGAHGFVGTRLMKELEGAIAAPSIQGMNEKQIRQIVEESEADVIIHTAAISDVGICEKIRKIPIMQMYFFRFIWRKHQTEEN